MAKFSYTTIEAELRDNLFKGKKDAQGKVIKPAINLDPGKFLRAVIVYNKRFQTYPGNALPDTTFFEQGNTPPDGTTGIFPLTDFHAHKSYFSLWTPVRIDENTPRGYDQRLLAYVPSSFTMANAQGTLGGATVPAGWYYMRGGIDSVYDSTRTLEWIRNDSEKHAFTYSLFNFAYPPAPEGQDRLFTPDPVPIIADEIKRIHSYSATDKQLAEGGNAQSIDEGEDAESETSYATGTQTRAPLTDDDERFLRAFYFDWLIPPELKNPDDEGYDPTESQHYGENERAKAQHRADHLDHFSTQTLSEQAILLYHLPVMMEKNKSIRALNNPYKRFATLDLKDPQNMSVLGNLLTSRSDMSALFEDIKPMHLSSMIPRVRVFKPFPTERGSDEAKVAEYHFEEYPDAQDLKRSMGTSTGTGLVSFEWAYQSNQNYEAAAKFIMAKMRLRTQSVDYLVKEMFDGSLPYRFSDMFSPRSTQEELSSTVNMGDTIPSPKDKKNLLSQVVVEYSINPNDKIWDGYSHLVESIQALKVKLTLNNTLFNLSLNDDGSIFVDLDFIGSVDATISDPRFSNILVKKESMEFAARKAQLLEQRAINIANLRDLEKRQEDAARLGSQDVVIGDGIDVGQAEIDLANYDELSDSVKELNALARGDLTAEEYEEFLTTKLQKRDLYSRITSRMIHEHRLQGIVVDPCDVKSAPRHIDNYNRHFGGNNPVPMYDSSGYKIPYFYYGDLLEMILEDKVGADGLDFNIRTVLGPMTIERSAQSGANDAASVGIKPGTGTTPAIDRYRTVSQCVDPTVDNRKSAAEKDAEAIAFCRDYLNSKKDPEFVEPETDVERNDQEEIEAFCEEQQELQAQREAAAATIEPSTFTSKSECTDEEKSFHVVNIADVPISFRLFQRFWSEKIANKNLYSYTVKQFLSDSINSLIVSALEAESTKEILPVQAKDVVMTTFSTTPPPSKVDAFGFNSSVEVEPRRGLLFLEDLKRDLLVPLTRQERLDPKAPTSDYLIVTVKDTQEGRVYRNTREDYVRDLEDGIYHLRSGQDAGIIKDIKMNIVNWDKYETYKIDEAMNNIKNGPIPRKRVYNCTVNLFGAPFFMPVQLVYVNPAAHGSLENLREMGLTGYYYVNDVQSKVENGSFMTTLQCTFSSSGEGCASAKDS